MAEARAFGERMRKGATALLNKMKSAWKPMPEAKEKLGRNERKMLDSELYDAISHEYGNVKNVITLIEKGANVNSRIKEVRNRAHLMCASKWNRYDICTVLIKNGAKIDARDRDGHTALMLAAMVGNTRICALLIENGADFSLLDNDNKNACVYTSTNDRDETAAFLDSVPKLKKIFWQELGQLFSKFGECLDS